MSKSLRVHCLQHVAFEGPGRIAHWLEQRGHHLSLTHPYRGETLPKVDSFDWLVIMGGPMNVYEHRTYPWLMQEKLFIESAIKADKTILGICLGAQLLADVLGGKVFQNREKEIGWWPIQFSPFDFSREFFGETAPEETVFHWHGDTFSPPPGARALAFSAGCSDQAFAFGSRVVGLQFHIESTLATIEALIEHCGGELKPARYIQTAQEIRGNQAHYASNQKFLHTLLEHLERETPGQATT